jgi:hypothetical protein
MKIDEVFEHVINVGPYGLNEEFKSLRNIPFSSIEEFKYDLLDKRIRSIKFRL